MYGSKINRTKTAGRKKSSPIRVVIRCAWSGVRLTMPTTNNDSALPPILGTSTLLDLVLRLESALPPSLFQVDAHSSSTATLVCLRKVVPQSQWESTTLRQILDGDDGSAGVVLTLDLGAAGNVARAPKQSDPLKNAIASASSLLNIKPVVAPSRTSTAASPAHTAHGPTPMDISNDATVDDSSAADPINKILPERAWKKILQSNFDAVTKDCLNTLLKIIDNLLSSPNEPKVRSIRCANAAFEKKVGRCSGGYEFLYSIGFLPKYPAILGGTTQPEMLELTPENESRETLLRGRRVLIHSAVRELGMKEEDLPLLPKTPESLPPSTFAASRASTGVPKSNTRGTRAEFNVYRTHSHNVQSAALGAPDPYSDAASSISTTERQLQQLQSKKDKMERKMQSNIETDRGLVVYRAGSLPSTVERASAASPNVNGGGMNDSALVAARMKRMAEERKKREEGGFTTKAMRDLEKMKKAKVYSHAQIRVNFPDGTHLHAKFLPKERVSVIRSTIKSAFQPSLAQNLDFDLYIAPPRRLLNDTKTLEEEELLPAAKIHVSWKAGASPAVGDGGCYLRDELFSSGNLAAFPDAKPIVKEKKAPSSLKGKDNGIGNGGGAQSKEEAMMQRMLGKKSGLLGSRNGSDGSKNTDQGRAKKSAKPKWFKG